MLTPDSNIFLKLDNLQPSGSFKSRGIGNLMQRAIKSHGSSKPIRFYCSSGGNAGLACVTAAIALNRPATIVVPNSTSAFMINKLKTLGADVHQTGANWAEADAFLRKELLDKDANGVYVPPFDHPDIWAGHSSLIEELDHQLDSNYDAIVCSVGGGGLFCGIMGGLAARRFTSGKTVQVLAVETIGADSLTQSIEAKKHITLPGITSIAGSLGCVKVAKKAWELAQKENVTCLALSDAEAAMGCVRFADDERILVEVACGVSIASVYGGQLRETIGRGMSDEQWKQQRVVIEVCGGSGISLDILDEYREKYGNSPELQKKRKGVRAVEKSPEIETVVIDEKQAMAAFEKELEAAVIV